MLTNYHTHTTFCDGKSTPAQMAKAAFGLGFDALGFSGHGYTPFDLTYCTKDCDGYIAEISRLKIEYAGKMQIYTGIEEDCFALTDRSRFDYIIGSAHYVFLDGEYFPIDESREDTLRCLEHFDGNSAAMAQAYFAPLCGYILKRKPDIIGHFDLITKFEEEGEPIFWSNPEYSKIADKFIKSAAESGSLFEINTGAISRGYRKTPYPSPELIFTLKKCGAGVILSSDCHSADTIDCNFKETKKILLDAGFEYVYVLCDGKFKKDYIK